MLRLALPVVLFVTGCGSSSPAPQPAGPDKQAAPADKAPQTPANTDEASVEPTPDESTEIVKAEGTCEELEQRWEAEAAKLARACERKDDCSLLWSDYVCYALRSTSDDVSVLESIDAGMAGRCSTVECEPPPMIACKDGRCDWDL